MATEAEFSLDVIVEDELWHTGLEDPAGVVRRVVLHAAAAERAPGTAVFLLTSNAELAALNGQFRGKPTPTNVLSFPAPEEAFPVLGDVAIAHGVVAQEASDQGKPFAAHLAHLALHGFLHLLGYDHETEEDAAVMEGRETALLAELGHPAPY